MRENYARYDFRKIYQALFNFMTIDLSAFYFDIRKDTLYCDPASSLDLRACRTVLDIAFACLTRWLAPILCFTTEEVWQSRYQDADNSVHLETFMDIPSAWHDAENAGVLNQRLIEELQAGHHLGAQHAAELHVGEANADGAKSAHILQRSFTGSGCRHEGRDDFDSALLRHVATIASAASLSLIHI